MTYDEDKWSTGEWPTHSDANSANAHINHWATWGLANGNLCKGKLFLGCAFYGYNKDIDGNTLWGELNKVNYPTYASPGNYNRGDLPEDVTNKAAHCLNNGYGGIFTWELGYDLPATDPLSLLNAIYDAIAPVITGPSIACNSWTTYSVDNLSPGATVSWDKSENLVGSYNTNPYTYEVQAAHPAVGGAGWIKAIIAGPCDTINLVKNVWVGTPLAYITGPYVWKDGQELQVACVEPGQWATMRLINTHPDVTEFLWALHGEGEYPMMLGNGPAPMPFSISGDNPTRYVEVSYGIEGCAWNTTTMNVPLCPSSHMLLVSPNPASHTITISETEAGSKDYAPWMLRLVSSQGRVMTDLSVGLPETIKVGGFQPGIYILHAQKAQHSEQHVIVVE